MVTELLVIKGASVAEPMKMKTLRQESRIVGADPKAIRSAISKRETPPPVLLPTSEKTVEFLYLDQDAVLAADVLDMLFWLSLKWRGDVFRL